MDTNKMRDISREQFEEVFQAKFPCIYAAAKAGESKAHGDMSVAWWGWQASREAVVVELPARKGIDHYCYDQGANCNAEGHNQCLVQVAAAIEAQGLKVKP